MVCLPRQSLSYHISNSSLPLKTRSWARRKNTQVRNAHSDIGIWPRLSSTTIGVNSSRRFNRGGYSHRMVKILLEYLPENLSGRKRQFRQDIGILFYNNIVLQQHFCLTDLAPKNTTRGLLLFGQAWIARTSNIYCFRFRWWAIYSEKLIAPWDPFYSWNCW